MNCDQFQQRLNQLVDQRLPAQEDPLLQQHSAECHHCCRQMQIWGQIDQHLEDIFTEPQTLSLSLFAPPTDAGAAGEGENGLSEPVPTLRPSAAPVSSVAASRGLMSLVVVAVVLMFFARSYVSPPFNVRDGGSSPLAQASPSGEATTHATQIEGTAKRGDPRSDDPLNEERVGISSDPVSPREQGGSPSGDDKLTEETVSDAKWWHRVSEDRWVKNTVPPVVHSMSEGVAPIGRSMKRAIAILLVEPSPSPADPTQGTSMEAPSEGPQGQTSHWRLPPSDSRMA